MQVLSTWLTDPTNRLIVPWQRESVRSLYQLQRYQILDFLCVLRPIFGLLSLEFLYLICPENTTFSTSSWRRFPSSTRLARPPQTLAELSNIRRLMASRLMYALKERWTTWQSIWRAVVKDWARHYQADEWWGLNGLRSWALCCCSDWSVALFAFVGGRFRPIAVPSRPWSVACDLAGRWLAMLSWTSWRWWYGRFRFCSNSTIERWWRCYCRMK